MKYLTSPNLPSGRVTDVLISESAGDEIFAALERLGIRALKVGRFVRLPYKVSSHADLIYHHVGNNLIFSLDRNNIAENGLHNLDFTVKYDSVPENCEYPYDVALDAARIGSRLICNKRYVSKQLLGKLADYVDIIDVRQGYAKCSICVVDDNSIITADSGISEECLKAGIDVLKISAGGIELPGYDGGFIGGCCGKLDTNVMAFAGDISTHQDCGIILDFLSSHGVEAVNLAEGSLKDIGGIIPIAED